MEGTNVERPGPDGKGAREEKGETDAVYAV